MLPAAAMSLQLQAKLEVLKNSPMLLPLAITGIILYLTSLCIYRLFFHPLAKFPGPKLAAITRYYEAYYDVVQNGTYTFKIKELHKTYGPIIRISPYELHISDPAYFEKLYRQDGSWNKYNWSYDAFSAPYSAICTIDHNAHRRRRAALNPFFSKASVAKKQGIIQDQIDKLCSRINDHAGSELNLSAALSAFSRDVANKFILGKDFNNLDSPDFNIDMTNVVLGSGGIWRITKHIRWFGPTMQALPQSFVERLGGEGARSFFTFIKDILRITQEIVTAKTSSSDGDSTHTLVHDILASNLPPAEKTVIRINEEIATVTGAAFETSAQSLRLILYYVYSDPEMLQRLRTELSGIEDGAQLSQLEKLPYLTAVLMEGLRLAPGLATRMARIAPDRELVYEDRVIPAGTPVGMTTILMHMDENVYPNPKRFDPQRWVNMGVDEKRKTDRAFAPFSRGTRVCLGMYFAWAELYMTLAAIVRQFDFKLEEAAFINVEPASDQFIIGTKNQSGVKVHVMPVSQ